MSDLQTIGITVTYTDSPTDEEILARYSDDMFYEVKGKTQINENVFAECFRDTNNLRYNNGLFYTRTGKATEELLQRDIWQSIKDIGINTNVEATVKRLMGTTRLASTVQSLTTNPKIIPFRNGDLHTDTWEFRYGEFTPSAYRLAVDLLPDFQQTKNFDKWLQQLFTKDDVRTIQEFLGYCLVPTTKSQKSLFLVGEGGVGKSVMGVILESILGDAIISTSNTQEFLQDKFKLPELEHKLVLYDDDLDNDALTGTGLYKKLITNNIAITADRKYGQPFKFTPYCKLVSCCNEMLKSLYDNTDGFYRRLLPVLTKPKPKGFIADLHFYDKIRAEKEGIVQWALIGLIRLIKNDWVIYESNRTKEYLQGKQSIGDPFPEFMETVFDYDGESEIATVDMSNVFTVWCHQNSIKESDKALTMWLSDNLEKYNISKSRTVRCGNRYVRGYKGLKIKKEWQPTPTVSI